MEFTGFGEAVVDFYEGLQADNTKAYWADHRALYDEHVRAPMEALLAALEPEFGPGKVFRPFRDVRFSADKTPYKTACGAYSERGGYLQVSAEGLMVAGGYYDMAADQVSRYREAVADERRGAELERRCARLRAAGLTVGGAQLKTRPRGVPADHPRLELLRYRNLHAARSWPPDDVLHQPACAGRVAEGWRGMVPLTGWLDEHVGASEQPRR